MRKGIRSLVSILMVLGLLVTVGCASKAVKDSGGGDSSAKKKEYTIAVFISNAGDPYFQNKSFGYVQGARTVETENQGVKINLELRDAGGYDQAEKQISQVEDAIQRKVDAIIITATNKDALAPVVNKAMKAGIPVVNDDVLVATKTTISISENSYNVGRNEAAYIATMLNGQGNVVMLKGPAGAQLFMDRATGAHDEFKRYPGINVIAEQWHQMTIEASRKTMDDYIQAHGKKISAVYAAGAVPAMGAVAALKGAGYKPGEVPVLSIDIHDELIKQMNEGWVVGTVPAQPVKLARLAVLYAFKAANGEKVPERLYTTDDTVVDHKLLPSFDLSDAIAPKGWAPPLK